MWKFFDSSGAEKVISVPRPSLVTALPSNPSDGDEIIFTDSLTAPTYTWHFRYVSAKASNKWVFMGGSPLAAEVSADQSTASTTYAALTTAGPSVAIPVAGDYIVELGCRIYNSTGGDGGAMSYDIGGTGAVDGDWVLIAAASGANAPNASFSRRKLKSGLTAVTLTAKYRATAGGTANFAERRIEALPVAVGG